MILRPITAFPRIQRTVKAVLKTVNAPRVIVRTWSVVKPGRNVAEVTYSVGTKGVILHYIIVYLRQMFQTVTVVQRAVSAHPVTARITYAVNLVRPAVRVIYTVEIKCVIHHFIIVCLNQMFLTATVVQRAVSAHPVTVRITCAVNLVRPVVNMTSTVDVKNVILQTITAFQKMQKMAKVA